jgi:hypothetical protein
VAIRRITRLCETAHGVGVEVERVSRPPNHSAGRKLATQPVTRSRTVKHARVWAPTLHTQLLLVALNCPSLQQPQHHDRSCLLKPRANPCPHPRCLGGAGWGGRSLALDSAAHVLRCWQSTRPRCGSS